MKRETLVIVLLFISLHLFSQDRAEKQRLRMNSSIINDNMNTISNVNYAKKTKLQGSRSTNVTMINGKMMVVRKGKMSVMRNNVTMRDGTIVMPNGLIFFPLNGGTVIRMQEGAYVNMFGKISYNTRKLNKIIKRY